MVKPPAVLPVPEYAFLLSIPARGVHVHRTSFPALDIRSSKGRAYVAVGM